MSSEHESGEVATNGTSGAPAYNPSQGYFDIASSPLGPLPATILTANMQVVLVTLQVEDKEVTASFCPGRMYVNASTNMIKAVKTQKVLKKLLKEGELITVQVQKLKKSKEVTLQEENQTGSTQVVNEDFGENNLIFHHPEKKDSQKPTTKVKNVEYGVQLLALGELPSLSQLTNVASKFSSEEDSFTRNVSQAMAQVLKPEEKIETEEETYNWFLVHFGGPLGWNPPLSSAEYPKPSNEMVKGVVKALHRPWGGVVDVGAKNGGAVAFHRNVVHLENGVRIGVCEELEEIVKIGQEVWVDIVENTHEGSGLNLLHGCANEFVSSKLYTSPVDSAKPELEKFAVSGVSHRLRIVELKTDSSSGAITSGVGTIQWSKVIKTGGAAASMVGEYATFSAEDLHCYGYNLAKVDLGHLLTYGDEISCQLSMLDRVMGKAQYKVRFGWIDKVEVGKPCAYLPAERPTLHKFADKLGMEIARLEVVLSGRAGYVEDVPGLDPNYAVCSIVDLEPAENNETVSRGLLRVEAGPQRGKQIKFNRSKATLLGASLEKADLLYIVRPNDKVFCEISGLADYPEGQYVSQQVQFFQPCPPSAKESPLEELSEEHMGSLLLWLQMHNNMTFSELKQVLLGQAPNRYFIPFPRDVLQGRVVEFDPVRSNKYGATSGTIVIEQGNLNVDEPAEGEPGVKNMEGVRVTFHRSCFWVYGRKMAKADLSYVVQPNQRVSVECRKITEEDRRAHSALPQDIEYRATIIYIGPSRPRNDRADPNRNDTGIFQWLAKRGLNIGQFTRLVEGKVPPHRPQELDRNNFYLPPVRGEGVGLASSLSQGGGQQQANLPVLRHGPVIAHILDSAISSSGPADPRLFTLLENDDMAQAAHHVAEALRHAIQYYKEASQEASYGRGYGSAGPGGKRPNDNLYSNYHGWQNKKQRMGRGGY